jgi:hypothetical protein
VAKAKAFLLRINPEVLDAVQRWANDDLRSLNGQIEFLLRKVLAESGRVRAERPHKPVAAESPDSPPSIPHQPDEEFID